jgi:hypothetical protein
LQLTDNQIHIKDNTMKFFFIILLVSIFIENSFSQTDIKQTFVLGQHNGGGIIFYIDPTGQHGLIAAPIDQSDNACWGKEGLMDANFMNDGAFNTKMIVSFMKGKHWMDWQGTPAACLCDTLSLGGFLDWYLPSINELKGMYDKQNLIEDFVAGDYCSSTQSSSGECWNIHFRPHKRIIFHYHKTHVGYNVRCIRKF